MAYPNDNALLLIAILPTPRDLEIARILGWYRIPLRKAPKVIAVDYLAFYQPLSFGKGGAQIAYIAPVLGHELTLRKELLKNEANHPRAAEEYFKVQIGPLQELPRPIPATKWRRITFLYTTGEYLRSATNINDLVVNASDRQALWQALRERNETTSDYSAGDMNIEMDSEVLAYLGLLLSDENHDMFEQENKIN